jgi:uncharacterized HAD superfamily protein
MFIYRDAEPPFGSVLIVDIDGVIADASAHQHFLTSEIQNWEAFFEAASNTRLFREGRELVKSLDAAKPIFLMTARPSYLLEKTVDWLNQNEIYWDALLMREGNDDRSSPEVKLDLLRDLIECGYKPTLALDDDPRNLLMFWEQKIPSIYIHSGYYE